MPFVSLTVASAGQMWHSALRVVQVKSGRLSSSDISALILLRIPACILLQHTCSLAKIAHIAVWLCCSLCVVSPLHKHTRARILRVWIWPSTRQSSLTAWLTHSSPVGAVMSRSTLFGPTWQREITSKPAWIFSLVSSSPFLSPESGKFSVH